MTGITLILIAAAIAAGFARWLRLPMVPLLVISGVGLSAFGPDFDADFFTDVLMLGLMFLVFMAGTELNPRRVGAQTRPAVIVGLLQFFSMGILGCVIGRLIDLNWLAAGYVGLALAASSTLVVLSILRQRQQFFEPFGRMVLGVLLLQDILVIVGLAALSRADDGLIMVALNVGMTLMMVMLAIASARWLVPAVLLKLQADEEALLLTTLALLFGYIGLSYWLDLPIIIGAFLAGVALSGFPTRGVVRGQLNSLSEFFLAAFFVALGAMLVMPTFKELIIVAGLVAAVVVVTPLLVTFVAERTGLSARSSIEGGLLLAQCSELSIVVVLMGLSLGHLPEHMMGVIAMVTVSR